MSSEFAFGFWEQSGARALDLWVFPNVFSIAQRSCSGLFVGGGYLFVLLLFVLALTLLLISYCSSGTYGIPVRMLPILNYVEYECLQVFLS